MGQTAGADAQTKQQPYSLSGRGSELARGAGYHCGYYCLGINYGVFMKYRFTAEDFYKYGSVMASQVECDEIAARANALLEQWEKESETVYGLQVRSVFGALPWIYTTEKSHVQTHKAILWRPEKIDLEDEK